MNAGCSSPTTDEQGERVMSIKKTLYEKDLYDDEERFQKDCAEIAK